MGAIWLAAVALSFTGWLAQTVNLQPATAEPTAAATAKPTGPLDWVCPMDRDGRSDQSGVCPRCGMTLVLGIPDEAEYPMTLLQRHPDARITSTVETARHPIAENLEWELF